MTHTISNSDTVIDSRDVITRIEELDNELRDAYDSEQEQQATAFVDWCEAAAADDTHTLQDAAIELIALLNLAAKADSSADWPHGETLIRDSYFQTYIEELIDDCYELPNELTSGDWPYRHITIDYAAAAEEVKQDYMSVDYDGVEYWIRA